MNNAQEALNAFQRLTQEGAKQSSGVTFNLNHYFNTVLENGEVKGKKTIRILPIEAGSNQFFTTVYMHTVRADGKTKNLLCPVKTRHDGDTTECPFCQKGEKLWGEAVKFADSGASAEDIKEKKKEAAKFFSKEFFILRVIERGHESEGPKFWRFKKSLTKDGPMDKIMTLVQTRLEDNDDILDLQNGRDLNIFIDKKTVGHTTFDYVSNISDKGQSPLSESKEEADRWLNNPMKWEDVYSFKNTDFLRIYAEGGIPAWSKEEGKYVDKATIKAASATDYDSVLSTPQSDNVNQITEARVKEDIPVDDMKEEDLPF